MQTRSTAAQHNIPQPSLQTNNKGVSDEQLALVTRGFLMCLFDSLKTELQDLGKDLSQEMRNLRSDLTSTGEGVFGLEDNDIGREEDVEQLRQEILRLQEQQGQLRMLSEDLEKCSHCHNICGWGAPTGAEGYDIREYITALFRSILGWEDNRDLLVDCVLRAGLPGRAGSRPQDILMCSKFLD
ncbi:hypothetical protein NDU88_006233 [Pleurodeles waltl]|uniref:Uncharacterized protein n=1 Tax=Pleurodeles waltl TaxID=8319 RepID=A0AAV7TZP8_PLEWA|nr:hypothetical protein NDU88_006233 [Pleurodeles waltl]